ncbi:MAG: hypothetical protein OHK0048_10300 [Rhodoferax sp.]
MTIDLDLTKEQDAMFQPGCIVVLHPNSKHPDARRYRFMIENGVVPSEWHEIISHGRDGYRVRADAAFDQFVTDELSDYEYGEA